MKLPPEAYSYYLGLGASRSYALVAKHYGCSKRSVTVRAVRDGWTAKLKASQKRLVAVVEMATEESVAQMCERHLAQLQLVQRKAMDALATFPIETAADAVRLMILALRHERLVRGEYTGKTSVSMDLSVMHVRASDVHFDGH